MINSSKYVDITSSIFGVKSSVSSGGVSPEPPIPPDPKPENKGQFSFLEQFSMGYFGGSQPASAQFTFLDQFTVG